MNKTQKIKKQRNSLWNYQKSYFNNSYIPLDTNIKNIKIDIVYTFVDCEDIRWQKKFINFAKPANFDPVRYISYGEIYDSLKTVEKYMRWCNNIYIITDYQTLNTNKLSKWLKEKIVYIDHTDIIDKEFLPTFNSTVIESFIHKIPGLSELFLYFNDDTFLGNYIKIGDLIDKKNKIPYQYVIPYNSSKMYPKNMPWIQWRQNATALIYKTFEIQPNYRSNHNVAIVRKDCCELTYLLFEKELKNSFSLTRKPKTINFIFLSSCLGSYLMMYKLKETNPKISLYTMCNTDKVDNYKYEEDLNKILKIRPLFFCINNIQELCYKNYKRFIEDYLH